MRYNTPALSIFIWISLILTGHVHAQDQQFSGIVIDGKSADPLSGANVYLKSVNIGTTTDSDGFFTLSVPARVLNDSLIITYLGYSEYRRPLRELATRTLIRLQPLILESDKGITIYAEKLDLARKELPHAATVINLEEIERKGSSEISDLFKSDPSVRIVGNDLDGRFIEIRGSDANEVNVFMDGIQINQPGFNNAADMSVISPDNIEKLEILKGSNLVLLGSGAFGGVVNITTQHATKPAFGLKVKMGSYLSRVASAQLDIPLNDHLFLNYFGILSSSAPEIEYYSSELYVDKTPATDVKTMRHNHHFTLNYLTATGQYSAKVLGSFLDYEKPGWSNNRKNLLLAAAYQGDILSVREFDINMDYQFGDELIDRGEPGQTGFESNFLTQRLHMRLTKNFSTDPQASPDLNFQFLTEYFHDELVDELKMTDSQRSSSLYEASVYDNRGSLGGVLSLGDKLDSLGQVNWKIFGGVRGEFLATGKNYKIASYGFQVNFLKDKWKFTPYLNYGENIKFPTLLDNAYIVDVVNVSISEPGLDATTLLPEIAKSREFGFDFQYIPSFSFYQSLSLQFAYFDTEIANRIMKRPLEDTIIRTQLGTNQTSGIEAMLKLYNVLKDWTLGFSYGSLDVSNPLLYAYKPDQKYSIQIDYRQMQGFYMSGLFYFEGKSLAWDFNEQNEFVTAEVPPFFDFDFSAGYQFDAGPVRLNLMLSGYNVLDNAGYKFYNLKKRFLQLGIGIKY